MTATRSRHTQLPVTAVPRRGVQVLKGGAALIGALVLVVGLPIALYQGFGVPWLRSMPDRGWLTAEIDADSLLKLIAAVVWLAWAHFVVCLVVEAVAERRSRGLAPRVPGGGIGTQGLARRLVATMVLLVGATTVSISSASAATAPVGDNHVSAPARAFAPTMASMVETIDDLPGDGELVDADAGDIANQRKGVVTYYDVKPPENRNYDTLWDIAERYLGDGLRYQEIYELNKDVPQPDGRVLKNADLIHPGWVMQMPSDAKGPGLKVVDYGDQDQMAPSNGSQTDEATAQQPAPHESASKTAPAGSGASSTGSGPSTWTPTFGAAGGLLAAGLILRMRRQRAGLRPAQLWAMRGGRTPDPTDPTRPGSGARTHLRAEADLGTAQWLDRVLRGWSCEGAGARLPSPARCTVSPSGVVMAFSQAPEMTTPAGWSAGSDGRVWTCDRDTTVPLGWLGAAAPLPGLTTIGRRDDGSLLMLDLEAIPGLVSLGGAPSVARAVAMSIAVDTATHPWADERRVTMVGFADDLTKLGDGTVRQVDDIERVLESLENVARFQRSACRRLDTLSARTARARSGVSSDWTFELVVCSGVPDESAVERLANLAADQQVSLAVVVVGDCPEAAARFALTPSGRLSAGFLGVDVDAQQLAVSTYRAIADLSDDIPALDEVAQVSLDQVARILDVETQGSPASQEEPGVSIRLLGPIEIDTEQPVDDARRDLLTEIVVYAALHPRGVHTNRFSSAIWPRGVTDETRDAALRQAREWLGHSADRVPRLDEADGVWRLDPHQVRVDWDQFRSLINRAVESPDVRQTMLAAALGLVRGRPWNELPAGRYAWLSHETIEDDMSLAVGLTSRAQAEHSAAHDDGQGAREALLRGLALSPASEELWCAALRLAERFGGTADARIVADQMYAAIAEHGSPRGATAQTDALVDELLPGYRSRAA